MKMISTLAILAGSTNVSLLFTTFYNFLAEKQFVRELTPPVAFIILSLAYIGVVLLMEW